MKKQMFYLSILLLPFLGMIVINELVRISSNEKGYSKSGVTAINSAERHPHKCSWVCHNDTKYCKAHHVKLTKSYFDKTDPIYFGVIGALKSTGNYSLANIIWFVVLIPFGMFVLLIKSINIQLKIRQIKKG